MRRVAFDVVLIPQRRQQPRQQHRPQQRQQQRPQQRQQLANQQLSCLHTNNTTLSVFSAPPAAPLFPGTGSGRTGRPTAAPCGHVGALRAATRLYLPPLPGLRCSAVLHRRPYRRFLPAPPFRPPPTPLTRACSSFNSLHVFDLCPRHAALICESIGICCFVWRIAGPDGNKATNDGKGAQPRHI